MNFRPDRAIQIATIFTNPYFYQNPELKEDGTPKFKAYVPEHVLKDIHFVCTMKYADSVKGHIAFTLPKMENTLGEFLADKGYRQLRIAETEKYAHVTFFFDGTKNFDGVERPELAHSRRVLINSPKVATYDLQPEMSAYGVSDKLVEAIKSDKYDVIIINFANPDMVGHTGVEDAAIKAVEAVDTCVGRAVEALKEVDGQMFICADHGNAEQLLDYETGAPFTAHTTNPVPFILVNADPAYKLREGGCLADIAPTLIELMGMEQPKEMSGTSLLVK
jgi:2,3-bisphosphoglycerate-independent phosphoglycerate mutase